MTNRVAYAPHDFQKMCKQTERDHESKKLIALMERVKRQIAERENPALGRPVVGNRVLGKAGLRAERRLGSA